MVERVRLTALGIKLNFSRVQWQPGYFQPPTTDCSRCEWWIDGWRKKNCMNSIHNIWEAVSFSFTHRWSISIEVVEYFIHVLYCVRRICYVKNRFSFLPSIFSFFREYFWEHGSLGWTGCIAKIGLLTSVIPQVINVILLKCNRKT